MQVLNVMNGRTIVLGSRSTRRRELLGLVCPAERIEICPPHDSREAGFEGLGGWLEIARRLQEIARNKNQDVCQQVLSEANRSDRSLPLVLTADTVIVANRADGTYQVLGQPPEDESWRDVVRRWFRELYAGRSHIAATAVCLTDLRDGQRQERMVQSHVWMRDDVDSLIDWYLETDEPVGKAGGYALQGLASVFVTRVEGSISNVVGLPLEVILDMLRPERSS